MAQQSNYNNIVLETSGIEYLNMFDEGYIRNNEEFPLEGLDRLRDHGVLTANIPQDYNGWGWGESSHNAELLELLRYVGSHDLSLGRVFEGHVNALLLINNFGSEHQKAHYFAEALEGKLFGIWNSELPSEALKFAPHNQGYLLEGAKIFCSGANNVVRPIVTAQGEDGNQMIILHLDDYNLIEDYKFWQPFGMKASVSCRFNLEGQSFSENQLLGNSYDYVQEPDFSGGAARFAAVQLGGAHAAVKATIAHLKKLQRTEASEQITRVAKLTVLLETGDLWLKQAGAALDNRSNDSAFCVHYSNMFRSVIRDICEEVLKTCEMSVGLQGMMKPHDLERIHRDLTVYLKQPGPDSAFSAIGDYILKK